MARYLIVQDSVIVDDVEASSMRAAMEGLDVEGNGAFILYTVQGSDTVEFHTVTETKLSFTAGEDEDDSGEEE